MNLSLILNKKDYRLSEKHCDQFHDLCPCYCNAHMAYEFRGTSVRPSTPAEWSEWWDSNMDYEEPFVSRPVPHTTWSKVEMEKFFEEFTPTVQRVIVARMLPDYVKHAKKIFVGALPLEIYDYWLELISKTVKPIKDWGRLSGIPTHTTRRHHDLHKSTWVGDMPDLGTPLWHQKKWMGELGNIFRAKITQITITHNNFNNLIVVEFKYVTEFNDGSKWNFC
jgi:hypothetical protein